MTCENQKCSGLKQIILKPSIIISNDLSRIRLLTYGRIMPPRRNPRLFNTNGAPAPPPPPPPTMDAATFQAAVIAAITAAMAQVSNNGSGGGVNSSTNGQNQGRSRECTYKDFSNSKPIPLNGTGGVMALS